MTPETLTQKQVVATEKTVEYLVVTGDVVVYRLTTTTRSGRRKPKVTVSEGITSKAGLSAFRDGAVAMPQYSKERGAVFANADFREFMRTTGWLGDEIYKRFAALTTSPFTRFVAGEVTADDLVFVEGSSHTIYDAEGKPLPVAVLFNYIDGHMDNAHYDLDKALATLKARDDIRFVAEDRWRDAPDSVQRIPHYNASRGRDYCLAFVWMPSVEDYRRMVAQCEEYESPYPTTMRYRAVFDLDLLGLRAGGAAKHTDFYAYDSEPAGDEDE